MLLLKHEDKCKEFGNALELEEIHYGIPPYIRSYSIANTHLMYAKRIKFCPFCGEKLTE